MKFLKRGAGPQGVGMEQFKPLLEVAKFLEIIVNKNAIKTLSDLPPLMEPVSNIRVALPMARPCPLAEA